MRFYFLIVYLIFLNFQSYAKPELNQGDWVGLYLPDYMIESKEYPDFSWYSNYESYVLIISYKEKLIVKAMTFAGAPNNRRVSEFEGEIKNYNLPKQILKDKNCNISIELVKKDKKTKLVLKDSGYLKCGDVRFDGVYYEYINPAWKKDEVLLKAN